MVPRRTAKASRRTAGNPNARELGKGAESVLYVELSHEPAPGETLAAAARLGDPLGDVVEK